MTAHTCGVVVLGVEGHVVDVEVHISHGMVGTTIVGLPDTAVGESRDRARAAIQNSGCTWPERKITIGLSPASLHKRGPMLDLAIAVSVLAADGQVPAERVADLVCVGELALNGRVQPMTGTVVAALGALRAGRRHLVVPSANVAEAQLVPDLDVRGVSCLAELVSWLRGQPWEPGEPAVSMTGAPLAAELIPTAEPSLDLAEVRGQSVARKALEIAAAGGHHLAMLGPPGVGKTLLAERLPGLLPDLERSAALEVTAIHSVAGRLPANAGLVTRPPFEAPHHTATFVAMVGGGAAVPRVGLASLAHRGVLFLDEAPEFSTRVLDALRQPLESGAVAIARAGYSLKFPARFQLVLAANPCPCGNASSTTQVCRCAPAQRTRYLQRLSGPLMDRVDLRVILERPTRAELLTDRPEPTRVVAARVARAREAAACRLAGTPWRVTCDVPASVLRLQWPLGSSAASVLSRALDSGMLSARGADRVVRVAWTVADLAGHASPEPADVMTALHLRDAAGSWAA